MSLPGRTMLALAALATAAGEHPAPHPADAHTVAADLATLPLPTDRRGWPTESTAEHWAKVTSAPPAERQQLRWTFAMALLASQRPQEALGVLRVMEMREKDLGNVGIFRLAKARAEAESGRYQEAVASLDHPALQGNAEACAWRLRALAALAAKRSASAQLACAKPAIASRTGGERAIFLFAAVEAALADGRLDAARDILRFAPSRHPQTRLLAAEAALREGRYTEAIMASKEVPQAGPLAARARAIGIEAAYRAGRMKPAEALKQSDALRFQWRGDATEQRLAVLSWELALAANRPVAALDAASTLLRYFPGEPGLPRMLGIVAASFRRWLDPASSVRLPLAAGLLWDHRDLVPNGPTGDALVRLLATRLKLEGLHERAADLLEHQLAFRARDAAQGPLSIEVAQLRLLAGTPDKALEALRRSADTLYPDDIADARTRLEAIALFQLGDQAKALSVLDDVPGAAGLREELLWRTQRWEDLADAGAPRASDASPLFQVRVLRQAIARAMISDERGLADLDRRYRKRFAGLPTQAAFEALVAKPGAVRGDQLSAALAALPAISPAGEDADLIELSATALRRRPAPPSRRG